MAQARKAAKVQSKINMILFGDYFTGKSTLGIQMAMLKRPDGKPFRLLILDAEQGGCDDIVNNLEQQGVNLENIYIVYTQSLEEVNYYIGIASRHEDIHELDENGNETDEILLDADGEPFHPDAIFVDGTSVLKLTSQQSLLNLARRRAKIKANRNGVVGEERNLAIEDAQLSMREWGALNYSGQSFVLNLAASGLHWIITCRERAETENRYIEGKMETVNTGKFVPDSFKAVGYNAKTICRMYRNEEEPEVVRMYVEKDRTGVFEAGDVIENPSILAFQKIISKETGNNFVVKNTMEEAVDIEGKMYQKSLGIEEELKEEPVSETIESIATKIKDIIVKLDATKRSELKAKLKANELPTATKNIESLEQAQAIYDIAKTFAK